MKSLELYVSEPGRITATGAVEGVDALMLASLARGKTRDLLFVARDDGRVARVAEALALFAPDLDILDFPAWDCVPYDRVSPHGDVLARRLDVLGRLAQGSGPGRIVLTTVAGLLQRVPPRRTLEKAGLSAKAGGRADTDALVRYLADHGYTRTDTVMEPGEYAVRGGIVDLFPPGTPEPLRLDLFGDEIEAIRRFDPVSQRTTGTVNGFTLGPVNEVGLDSASIARFRSGYRELFGVPSSDDPCMNRSRTACPFPGWSIGWHCSMTGWTPCSPICPTPPWFWIPKPTRPPRPGAPRSGNITRPGVPPKAPAWPKRG